MKKVCIVGIGWLGLELAKKMKLLGYFVAGTTTSENKREELSELLDEVQLFDLNTDDSGFINGYDIIIITIPPSCIHNYSKNINELLDRLKQIEKNPIVFYTSSTSVYGHGNRLIDESSEINPETNSGKELALIESFLTHNFKERHVILRLGGLVGGERHPVKYLAGKTNVTMPLAPVNLLHRDDAINAIVHLTEHFRPGIYNLCSPEHPMKKEYYQQMAKQFCLPMVEFNFNDIRKDKIVTCIAINKLNFEFKYTSPYNFPT